MPAVSKAAAPAAQNRPKWVKELIRNKWLYIMLIPGIIIIFIFHYVQLGGLIIAFQRFIPAKGLFGNQNWVGLQNFQYIFSMPNTMNVLRNTVTIAVAKIVLGLVIPITVALLLNELYPTPTASEPDPDGALRCRQELLELCDRVDNAVFVSDYILTCIYKLINTKMSVIYTKVLDK